MFIVCTAKAKALRRSAMSLLRSEKGIVTGYKHFAPLEQTLVADGLEASADACAR